MKTARRSQVSQPARRPFPGKRGDLPHSVTPAEPSEQRLWALTGNLADSISVVDRDGVISYESQTIRRFLGEAAGEDSGRNAFELVHPDDLPLARRLFDELLQEPGARRTAELRLRHRDGSWRYVEVIGKNLLAIPAIGGIVLNSRDITARRQAEAALRESNERYRIVADFTYDWEFWINPRGRFVYVSPSCERVTGHKPADFVADPGLRRRLVHPDDRALFDNHVRNCERKRKHGEEEWRVRQPDGTYRRLAHTCQPIFDDQGHYRGVRSSDRDITEHKQADAAVQEAARVWQETFDSVTDAIFVLDAQQRIQRCNQAAATLFGKSVRAVVGRRCFEIMHGTKRAFPGCPLLRMRRSRQRESMDLAWCERWYQVVVDPLLDAGGKLRGAVHVVSDITPRKRAEVALRDLNKTLELRVAERTTALRQTEQRLQAILDNSPAVIFVKDSKGRYLLTNRRYQELFHRTQIFMTGKTDYDVFPKKVAAVFRANDQEVFAKRGPIEFEEHVPHDDGPHTYISVKFPFYGNTGELLGVCGIATDITERKRLEVEVQRISEIEKQRLGRDLHDGLNQQLTAIRYLAGALEVSLAQKTLPEAADAGKIVRELANASGLTRDLARGLFPPLLQTGNIVQALKELAFAVSNLFKIPCRFAAPRDIHFGDPDAGLQLFRIAQEAIHNAIKHSRGRHIWVQLVEKRGRVILTIKNDGVGISQKALERADMGLRIMQYRAGMLNANLTIARAPGRGTVVTCSLARPDANHPLERKP